MYSHERSGSWTHRGAFSSFKVGRYKSLLVLIGLLSAWVTIHITRGILDFHNNEALKTQERQQVQEKAAMEFREHRDRLAMDYHYGNMEEEIDNEFEQEVNSAHAQKDPDSIITSTTVQPTTATNDSDKNANDDGNKLLSVDELVVNDKTSELEKLKGDGMMDTATPIISTREHVKLSEYFNLNNENSPNDGETDERLIEKKLEETDRDG